jgi:hypothetical protein
MYQRWNEKSKSCAGRKKRFEQVSHPIECSSMHTSLIADKVPVQGAEESLNVKALEHEVAQLRAENANRLAGKFSTTHTRY